MSAAENRRPPIRHLVRRARRAASVDRVAQAWHSTGFPYRAARAPRGLDVPVAHPLGADYDTRWAREWPARFARLVAVEAMWKPMVGFFADPEIHGVDRLDGLDGPAIFAAGPHHSHADTPLLLTTIPEPWRNRMVIGAAADYFFPSRPAAFVSALFIGAVPVDRERANRRNIDELVGLLTNGWSTVLYPEGGRSPDGWGQEFKGGAAFLAKQSGVPVVPVYVDGTRRILPKGRTFPKRGQVLVLFGPPMAFGPGDTHKSFTDRLQSEVEALADEVATDWWRARRRLHASRTPTLTGPATTSWRRRWELTAKDQPRRRPSWPA